MKLISFCLLWPNPKDCFTCLTKHVMLLEIFLHSVCLFFYLCDSKLIFSLWTNKSLDPRLQNDCLVYHFSSVLKGKKKRLFTLKDKSMHLPLLNRNVIFFETVIPVCQDNFVKFMLIMSSTMSSR